MDSGQTPVASESGEPLTVESSSAQPQQEEPEDASEGPVGLSRSMDPVANETPAAGESSGYLVTLDAQVISGMTAYETVSPIFAGKPFAADYYPGELTVEITGQIVIESGGSLSIGTMAVGNTQEAHPVIRGTLGQNGLIVVKSGGSLVLKSTVLKLDGEGPFIVQEPGGSIYLTDTALDDSLVRWAPPMVNNLSDQPADLWLEEGTPLTEALLPEQLKTHLQYQGSEQQVDVPLQWDMRGYDGRISGELTLTGCFLDENGRRLASHRPLELVVHWYKPHQIIVSSAVWMGQTAASAKLQVEHLPEIELDIWGEVSADGGETWIRWKDLQVRENDGGAACVFYLPDDRPRHFRIRASYWEESRLFYLTSDSFLLPNGETDDSGGNRGGSTAPVVSEREPAPAEPESDSTPEPEASEPDPAWEPLPKLPGTSPEDTPDAAPESGSMPGPAPEAPWPDSMPEPSVISSEDAPDEGGLTGRAEPSELTPPAQALLAAAGLGSCAAIGLTVTHAIFLRKKKD